MGRKIKKSLLINILPTTPKFSGIQIAEVAFVLVGLSFKRNISIGFKCVFVLYKPVAVFQYVKYIKRDY